MTPTEREKPSASDDVEASETLAPKVDAAADPQEESTAPTSPAGENRWSRPVRAATMAAAVLIPLSAAAFFYTRYTADHSTLEVQNSARTTACEYAKTMTNYNAQNIDQYIGNVLDGATGEFKTEFSKTSSELKDVITSAQIKSEARDTSCGVANADDEHAEVVVAMSVSISSLGTQGRQVPSQISLVATMDRIDGHWLVSKLDAPALEPASPAPAPVAEQPVPR
ncbi:hypothetical protein ACFVJ5_30845 [Nocardia sp. NPDC127606]|uniref:hypothetical protein n=1 Tax=Nocardia sp. NPDC127606 TaxID=3345406 RepID=UPI00363810AE